MAVTFSNPRNRAEINDYPLGGNKRGKCVFEVETNKKGERCLRTTTGKPKVDTYATSVIIVDGSDGQTYILKYDNLYGSITIARHDFKNASEEVTGKNSATFWRTEERFTELFLLFASAIAEEEK